MYCREPFERLLYPACPELRGEHRGAHLTRSRRATRGTSSGHFLPLLHVYQSEQVIFPFLSHTSASPLPQALSFDIHPQTIRGRVGYPSSKQPGLSSRPEDRAFRGPSWRDRGNAASLLTISVRASFLSPRVMAASLPQPSSTADGRRRPSLHSLLPPRAGDSNRLNESFRNCELSTVNSKRPPLTPLHATLTDTPSRKSFTYHSYAKHPGVGGVTQFATCRHHIRNPGLTLAWNKNARMGHPKNEPGENCTGKGLGGGDDRVAFLQIRFRAVCHLRGNGNTVPAGVKGKRLRCGGDALDEALGIRRSRNGAQESAFRDAPGNFIKVELLHAGLFDFRRTRGSNAEIIVKGEGDTVRGLLRLEACVEQAQDNG